MLPGGSVVDAVIGCDGNTLCLFVLPGRAAACENLGQLPLAWIDFAAAQRIELIQRKLDILLVDIVGKSQS